jgi:hypothetical protein
MPAKWWKGWSAGNYSLLIKNSVSSNNLMQLPLGNSQNAPPVACRDDVTLYSGAGKPYFLIDVLADNGYGTDSDPESNSVTIIPLSKTSTKGGRVSLDKKSGKIKYIRPKATSANLANFTDKFQYKLRDSYGGESTAVDVQITISNN